MTCIKPQWRVGLVFTRKKIERTGFIGLEDYASQHGIHIIHMDITRSMEAQGPVNLIVHKMTDIVSRMNQGDEESRTCYNRFMSYCRNNPHVILLDQWEHIEKVLDRVTMFDYLRQCINVRDPFFKLPDSIPLDSIHSITQLTDRLSFPIICKRRSACSSTEAHQMTILPCEKYLNNTEDWIKYYDTKEPLILQKFIQHDGVIVKIYVAGGQIHVSTRPSIVNVTPETGVIYFDSQMLPKQFDTTTSSQTVQPFVMTCDDNNIQAQKDALLDHELLQRIAITLQKQSGLTFFGFDVLLESGTNDYYVVDLNYFPSFKNVTDFQSIFVAILKKNLVSSNIDIDQI